MKSSSSGGNANRPTYDGRHQWLYEILRFIGAAFEKQITAELVDAYADALLKHDRGVVEHALNRCRLECRTFPRLVEILSRIEDESPAKGKRSFGPEVSASVADRIEAERLWNLKIPHVFVAGQYQNSLIAFPFSEQQRQDYSAVCQRGDEWVESSQAQGPIPPCVSCYTLEGMANCTEDQVQACGRMIWQLRSSKVRAPGFAPMQSAAKIPGATES